MTKYRVEVEERTTRVCETWIEAESEDKAREAAEARMAAESSDWQEVYSDADQSVTLVENEDGEAVWEGEGR